MELWQIFGSRSEYLDAPYEETVRVRLALEAKWKNGQTETDEQLAEIRAKAGMT
jgi:hypothetical protein